MWTSHPDLEAMISSCWNIEVEGIAMFSIAKKLKNVIKNIKFWNKLDFGHIFDEKDEKKDHLHKV